ncbi:uncharacterized protein LOC132166499 [Corylus avellana]|uniref:uncharacterized protein LOC132166499 n=1 Tax=Corylus avellana TaxID=13451 RepID=UPI00286C58A8|nr:uncharacterized protein LOC132166499 [Corylus avellana]
MEIDHFSDHQHLLSLSDKERDDYVLCDACDEYCVGPTYTCSSEYYCDFALHESCAKLPQELRKPLLHPHPLARVHPKSKYGKFECNACSKICRGFTFRCEKCDINFDLKCAFVGPVLEEREEAVAVGTFSHHQHPLVLFEKIPAHRIKCRVCGKYCSDPAYACFPCRFFLHPSCFDRSLPQEIQHFYHPCPLTLYTTGPDKSSPCRACRQFWPRGGFYYGCSRCDFVMDIDCTLLPSTTQSKSDYQEEILHFLHGHPLSLISKIKADDKVINCYVCGKGCTDPTYACGCGRGGHCNRVYIHQSCLELTQDILDHSHPYHPLILKPMEDSAQCNACRKDINWNRKGNNFAYVCESNNCSFCLHIECSVIMPAVISDEGHDHLLQFRDNIVDDETIKCSACKSTCHESYSFRCLDLDCDFNLHHTCGPLPYTIQHKCHIDPLTLTHSLAEHENQRNDEFYCDACEEEIEDPLLPIYYCAECHFVAEISCVISEVISSLNEEYGKVELRNPLGQFGKVITKDTLKKMMQKKDKEQLKPTLTWKEFLSTLSVVEDISLRKTIREKTIAEKIEAYDHEEIIMFSDKAYTQFMEFLNHSKVSHNRFPYDWDVGSHTKEEVINVGEYMTTHRMRNIKVVDITDDMLLGWWRCLETLQFAGFKIEFAFDHLKRITHAHFGLYVEKQVDNVVDQLDRDIKGLTRKLERIKSAKSAKSSIIEECLREATVLRKGKAVTSRLL